MGLPMPWAAVKPMNTCDNAQPRRSGATRDTATAAAAGLNNPPPNAVKMRAISIAPSEGAKAHASDPTPTSSMAPATTARRGQLPVSATSSGEPTA